MRVDPHAGAYAAPVEPLTAAVAASAVVLTLSGVTKLVTPLPTERMLDALGIRGWPGRARSLGAAEVAMAAHLVVAGGRWPPLLAAMVFALLAFVANRARTSAPTLPCGCVGSRSTPVGLRHVVLDALFAAVLATAAASSPPPLRVELSGDLVDAVPTLCTIVLFGGVALLVLTGWGRRDGHHAA